MIMIWKCRAKAKLCKMKIKYVLGFLLKEFGISNRVQGDSRNQKKNLVFFLRKDASIIWEFSEFSLYDKKQIENYNL